MRFLPYHSEFVCWLVGEALRHEIAEGVWDGGGISDVPGDFVTDYSGDENGCYEGTNAFEFFYEAGCGVTDIAYGEDPGALETLYGGPFYGGFIFFGFGPS